jgi:hypothetical protein
MGAPGRIASQVILKDWSKGFKKSSSNSHLAAHPSVPTEVAVSSPAPVEKN